MKQVIRLKDSIKVKLIVMLIILLTVPTILMTIVQVAYVNTKVTERYLQQENKWIEITSGVMGHWMESEGTGQDLANVIIFEDGGVIGLDHEGEVILDTLSSIDARDYTENLIEITQSIETNYILVGDTTYRIDYLEDGQDGLGYYNVREELGIWPIVNRWVMSEAIYVILALGCVAMLAKWLASEVIMPVRNLMQKINYTEYIEDFSQYQYNRSNELGVIVKEFNKMMERVARNTLQMRRNEQKYRIAMESISDISFEIDIKRERFVTNTYKWSMKRGYEIPPKYQDAVDCIVRDIHPRERKDVKECLSVEAYQKKISDTLEYRVKGTDGKFKWEQGTFVAIKDEDGKVVKIVCYIKDIDKRKRFELEAVKRSKRDALTGVYNKIAIKEKVDESLEEREPNKLNALLFLDLDDFKGINDNYGHQIGDNVLEQVVKIMRSNLTPADYIGRVGGDEFIIFLNGRRTLLEIHQQMDNIVRALNVEYICDDGCYIISTSMGGAIDYGQRTYYEQLFKQADSAMYEAKSRGKNKFTIYEIAEVDKKIVS